MWYPNREDPILEGSGNLRSREPQWRKQVLGHVGYTWSLAPFSFSLVCHEVIASVTCCWYHDIMLLYGEKDYGQNSLNLALIPSSYKLFAFCPEMASLMNIHVENKIIL